MNLKDYIDRPQLDNAVYIFERPGDGSRGDE